MTAHPSSPALPDPIDGWEAFYELPNPRTDLLLTADHASRAMPERYEGLGLPQRDLDRHVAYDIGTEALTHALAARLGAPAVLSHFSRLLIDPNRGLDDPTLIMRLSDGAIVPGNARIDAAERALRIETFYRPYDDAVARQLERLGAPGYVAVHSYTPFWKGAPRPWHVGVMWDGDPSLALAIKAALDGAGEGFLVGENVPYEGEMEGSMLDRHAKPAGCPAVVLEVRNDLISDEAGVAEWADRLAPAIEAAVGRVMNR